MIGQNIAIVKAPDPIIYPDAEGPTSRLSYKYNEYVGPIVENTVIGINVVRNVRITL